MLLLSPLLCNTLPCIDVLVLLLLAGSNCHLLFFTTEKNYFAVTVAVTIHWLLQMLMAPSMTIAWCLPLPLVELTISLSETG